MTMTMPYASAAPPRRLRRSTFMAETSGSWRRLYRSSLTVPRSGDGPPIIVLTPEVSKMCAEDSAKAGCNAWLAHPTVADDLARTVRQVLNAESAAPASADEALLGLTACPVCESPSIRATLRVGAIQYYCCRTCSFCWRAEALAGKM